MNLKRGPFNVLGGLLDILKGKIKKNKPPHSPTSPAPPAPPAPPASPAPPAPIPIPTPTPTPTPPPAPVPQPSSPDLPSQSTNNPSTPTQDPTPLTSSSVPPLPSEISSQFSPASSPSSLTPLQNGTANASNSTASGGASNPLTSQLSPSLGSSQPPTYGTPLPTSVTYYSDQHNIGDPTSPQISATGVPNKVGATTKLNVGAIVGGVVGGIVFILLVLLAVFVFLRHRKKKHLAPSAEFLGKNATFQRVPSFVEASYRHHPPSSFSPMVHSASLRDPVTTPIYSNPFDDPAYHSQPVLNPSYVNLFDDDPGVHHFSPPEEKFGTQPLRPPISPSSSNHSPVLFAPHFKFPNHKTTNLYP